MRLLGGAYERPGTSDRRELTLPTRALKPEPKALVLCVPSAHPQRGADARSSAAAALDLPALPSSEQGIFLGPRPGGVTDFKFSTCTGRSYFNCIPHPNHPICFQRIPRSSAFGHTSPSASFLGLSTRSASRPYFLQLSLARSSPTRSSFRKGCGAAAQADGRQHKHNRCGHQLDDRSDGERAAAGQADHHRQDHDAEDVIENGRAQNDLAF